MQTELFISLCVAHLLGDFVFANHEMAVNKHNPRTVYFYLHGFIHFILCYLFSGGNYTIAAIVALTHMIIDTRLIVNFWQDLLKQTKDGDIGIIVKMALDQTLHIATIYFIVRISIELL